MVEFVRMEIISILACVKMDSVEITVSQNYQNYLCVKSVENKFKFN